MPTVYFPPNRLTPNPHSPPHPDLISLPPPLSNTRANSGPTTAAAPAQINFPPRPRAAPCTDASQPAPLTLIEIKAKFTSNPILRRPQDSASEFPFQTDIPPAIHVFLDCFSPPRMTKQELQLFP